MNESDSNETNEPNAKKRKPNNESDRNEVEAIAGVSNRGQSADILKLNIDCFEEVFDYLCEKDLFAISKTCKRLKQVVGYILKQNYPKSKYLDQASKYCTLSEDHLIEFTGTFRLRGDNQFQDFLNIQPRLLQVTKLVISDFHFTTAKIECMKETLKKVERLRISKSVLCGNFHDSILALCPNLKRLSISNNLNIGTGWIVQKYPKLDRILWYSNEMKGLTDFLDLNPNIRLFITNSFNLWPNRNSIMNAKITLDAMIIQFLGNESTLLIRLLNRLHKRGIYKRLCINIYYKPTQQMLGSLASLDALVALKFMKKVMDFNFLLELSELKNLEALSIKDSEQIADIEALANNLTKLERIEFDVANFNDILPLISRAANLQTIRVYGLKEGIHFNATTKIINLAALKKMREKLRGAKNIALYIEENIYLATKWAYNKTYFGLIKIFRCQQYPYTRTSFANRV